LPGLQGNRCSGRASVAPEGLGGLRPSMACVLSSQRGGGFWGVVGVSGCVDRGVCVGEGRAKRGVRVGGVPAAGLDWCGVEPNMVARCGVAAVFGRPTSVRGPSVCLPLPGGVPAGIWGTPLPVAVFQARALLGGSLVRLSAHRALSWGPRPSGGGSAWLKIAPLDGDLLWVLSSVRLLRSAGGVVLVLMSVGARSGEFGRFVGMDGAVSIGVVGPGARSGSRAGSR